MTVGSNTKQNRNANQTPLNPARKRSAGQGQAFARKKEDEGPDDQSNWMPVEDTLVWTIVRLLAVGSILGWILGDLIFCSPFKSFEFDLQTCLACARVSLL